MTARDEESLDPASWEAFRAHGHQVLDELLDWLSTLRERPVWQPVPPAVREALQAPLPHEGQGLAGAWADFREQVLPYPWGNVHPRFWGWVNGTGSPSAALAELATAVLNTNAGGGHQAAPYVERQVLDWCKDMLGFPASASGVMVTGGSVANLVALAAARDAADPGIVQQGVAAAPRPLVVYASSETHNSVEKAVRLLGLGRRALRSIPVTADFTMDLEALAQAIAADRAAGAQPCCVVGNAGTVNTAAIDDLAALADLCARESLWFHVDGAFGALAAIAPSLRPLVAGLERADSVAFDLHKWMYMPYDVGCVLVKDPEAHRRPFATQASYLARLERGAAPNDHDPGSLGPELSREFRGLKVWLTLKEHGLAKFARLIEQNVAQAKYLAGLVHRHRELELLAPVPLNIVCFRYCPAGSAAPRDDTALDGLNKEVLMRLQERGYAVPSGTLLRGRFAIRVAITNHRTVRADLDLLAARTVELGRELRGAHAG
ncbi:MAG TPA: aminotransferase class I/II-fold pyridoxal phosphate-dependent enzyme [Gemmatimonadales bacterium]|nr:aminotransferase class I/II-fold pyridoxal phosphate-dependent enzyme [Gemmatimonadales bacterium]